MPPPEPVDVDLGPIEVDPLPLQAGHFGGAQAMPVRHQHHQPMAITVPVVVRSLDQPLHLVRPQVLALPRGGAARRVGGLLLLGRVATSGSSLKQPRSTSSVPEDRLPACSLCTAGFHQTSDVNVNRRLQ